MLDCSKIDELMMDWLYRELDESSSARVAEHVAGCARCSAEASAISRTRQAFRELSPVDPPMALSAILLHEAARRAPSSVAVATEPADEVGFWDRVRSWFRPIVMHPAAAAVAMLVLIAGVAGTLYVRHGDEMTDTRDVTRAAAESGVAARDAELATPATPAAVDAPAEPEAPAAEASPGESDDSRADRDGYVADVLGKEAQEELSREVAEQRLEHAAQDAAKRFSTEKKPSAPMKKSRKPADAKGPIANAVSGADPLIEGETGNLALEGGLRGGGSAQGRAADKMQKSSQPPPPPPSSTSSTAKPTVGATSKQAIDFADPGAGDGQYRVYKEKPMSESELRANEGKLGAAVKKRDCTTAARIANDILDRNPAYYTKKVAASAKPCQGFVANETRARSARRASKNVGSGGKNVGAPQKPKAAPQKDQAAEAAE